MCQKSKLVVLSLLLFWGVPIAFPTDGQWLVIPGALGSQHMGGAMSPRLLGWHQVWLVLLWWCWWSASLEHPQQSIEKQVWIYKQYQWKTVGNHFIFLNVTHVCPPITSSNSIVQTWFFTKWSVFVCRWLQSFCLVMNACSLCQYLSSKRACFSLSGS